MDQKISVFKYVTSIRNSSAYRDFTTWIVKEGDSVQHTVPVFLASGFVAPGIGVVRRVSTHRNYIDVCLTALWVNIQGLNIVYLGWPTHIVLIEEARDFCVITHEDSKVVIGKHFQLNLIEDRACWRQRRRSRGRKRSD